MAVGAVDFLPYALLIGVTHGVIDLAKVCFKKHPLWPFVVEGILEGRKKGSDILAQYKQSILLSALVMLIAIGTLVFAVHPAMHSLGAVTLIGMICVVGMAFVVPPILFDFVNYVKHVFCVMSRKCDMD